MAATNDGKRPRRRPGENREMLLVAAISEFGLFGYHGASTSSIARKAEVPQPHVYASFATKKQLFLACVDRVFSELGVPSAHPSPDNSRFLYQAIALVAAGDLAEDLRSRITLLRESLGDAKFSERILEGAESILGIAR